MNNQHLTLVNTDILKVWKDDALLVFADSFCFAYDLRQNINIWRINRMEFAWP